MAGPMLVGLPGLGPGPQLGARRIRLRRPVASESTRVKIWVMLRAALRRSPTSTTPPDSSPAGTSALIERAVPALAVLGATSAAPARTRASGPQRCEFPFTEILSTGS